MATARGSLELESEMMPQDPSPWVIRSAAWLLIAMFCSALLGAIFIRLPETVSCAYVLVPEGGADPIQSPRAAVVSKVCVAEGQSVTAGTELFVLRSEELRGLDTQLRTLSEDLQTREANLARSEASYVSQLEIKRAEIEQAESEVKFREKHAATSRDLVARLERISAGGGISQVELMTRQLALSESEKDQSVAQRTLQQVILDLRRMETERSRQRGEEEVEIAKLKVRIAALKADLENAQQNLLSIPAPYDAVVLSLAQRNAGSVVQNGQELCQLAPLESKPRARLALNESSLSRLAVGQRVRLFFEAYPYQRYGAASAKLGWISPSTIASAEGPHFVALASLDQNGFKVRGQPHPLRVGMRGEARVVVGRRAIIEYAFEPLRKLREGMRE